MLISYQRLTPETNPLLVNNRNKRERLSNLKRQNPHGKSKARQSHNNIIKFFPVKTPQLSDLGQFWVQALLCHRFSAPYTSRNEVWTRMSCSHSRFDVL